MSATTATNAEQAPPPREPAAEGPRVPISLGVALAGNNNSLGLLRLILASIVIFDHAFPLGGYGTDPFFELTHGQASLGTIAVGGFFAISGYLIAKSGQSGDVVQFMWRRVLRIFPAYWVLLIFTAVIVGPLVFIAQGENIADYFHLGGAGPFTFLSLNWTLNIGTYGIYDLFTTTTPYGELIGSSAVNGSIWTLIYEWNCYLMIAVLVLFGVLKNAKIVVPVLTAGFLLLQVLLAVDPQAIGVLVPRLADPYTVSLTLTFLFGSLLAVYSSKVPFDDRIGILAGLVFIISLRYGGFSTVGTAAGAYLVMYLAARLPARLHWIGRKNDYSYGIYIYGFLVQQVLAFVGLHRVGYVVYTLTALVVTAGLAWLSWHLVEKRAMALKSRGPGRGVLYWRDRVRARFLDRKANVQAPRAAEPQTPKD
jgi:peptidoglycan/LPS O-acetylase OafA/YrhL